MKINSRIITHYETEAVFCCFEPTRGWNYLQQFVDLQWLFSALGLAKYLFLIHNTQFLCPYKPYDVPSINCVWFMFEFDLYNLNHLLDLFHYPILISQSDSFFFLRQASCSYHKVIFFVYQTGHAYWTCWSSIYLTEHIIHV